MSEWISVKDRLPNEWTFVLVYCKMPGTNEPCPISIAMLEDKEWDILGDNAACACGDLLWGIDSDDITHWMPLPEPPK